MSSIQARIFKYRSYTPVPFLILMFLYADMNVWGMILGFLIAFTGEMTRLWGVSYAGSETRTTGPVGGTYLVISGPFSHVRNPLYLGNMLLYFGIGIMSNALFPVLQILALVFFYFQYMFIIREEEAYLRTAFGQDYEEYYNSVPRLIPSISAYRNSKVRQPSYNFAAGLRSEKRTLQAFGFVVISLLLIKIIRGY